MGAGRPHRPQVGSWLLPVGKGMGKEWVQQGVVGGDTADDGGWGRRRWQSASFESTIGKLGRVSGQTGLLRQRLMREDGILP